MRRSGEALNKSRHASYLHIFRLIARKLLEIHQVFLRRFHTIKRKICLRNPHTRFNQHFPGNSEIKQENGTESYPRRFFITKFVRATPRRATCCSLTAAYPQCIKESAEYKSVFSQFCVPAINAQNLNSAVTSSLKHRPKSSASTSSAAIIFAVPTTCSPTVIVTNPSSSPCATGADTSVERL